MQPLKSDIKKYWISCADHLSNIIDDSMSKRIDSWILNKGNGTGNKL